MIAGSLGAGVSLMPRSGRAGGFNALDPLSAPSIPVRDPKGVFLVAVASAGNRVVAVGEEGVIIYSDDNGQSWTQAEVPVSVNLTCVRFATPLQGWAAGHFGVILGTTDGGKTWQTLLNGLQVNQLTLQAAQAATAQPAADSSNAPPGLAFAMRRANAFVAQGPSIPFLSILLLGPNKLIVFGAYRMAMLTTDGGKPGWIGVCISTTGSAIISMTRSGSATISTSSARRGWCSARPMTPTVSCRRRRRGM